MARRQSMQQVCNEIQPDQIQAYMLSQGWRLADSEHADAIFFENDSGDDGPYRIWIWANRERPKFQSRIQNLLFSLSVIEGREPLEIGTSILDVNSNAQAAPESETSRARLTLRNSEDVLVQCSIFACESRSHELRPDESIELVFHGSSVIAPEVACGTNRIDVQCATECTVQVFQGTSRGDNGLSLARLLSEELERSKLDAEVTQSVLSELKSVLTRADFEIQAEGDETKSSPTALRRQTAIVAAALAKQLSSIDEGPTIVWHVVARTLAKGLLKLELRNNSIAELFQLALADDELAPAATAKLLNEISHD